MKKLKNKNDKQKGLEDEQTKHRKESKQYLKISENSPHM